MPQYILHRLESQTADLKIAGLCSIVFKSIEKYHLTNFTQGTALFLCSYPRVTPVFKGSQTKPFIRNSDTVQTRVSTREGPQNVCIHNQYINQLPAVENRHMQLYRIL